MGRPGCIVNAGVRNYKGIEFSEKVGTVRSTSLHSVTWQDRRREFLLHVPRRVAERPAVVLVFHGAGSHAQAMIDFTGMSDQAEQSGWAVVYPEGSGRTAGARTWNTGAPFLYATRRGVDDVGFVEALLQALPGLLGFQPQCVFASGMSNGAAFCYRLANGLPGSVAAIGSVAGCPMEAPRTGVPRPRIIHFHGTDDQFVPYFGGHGPRGFTRSDWPPVEDSLRAWTSPAACDKGPRLDWLPDRAGDGTRVRRLTMSRDLTAEQVVLYTIDGGGHTWPGRQPPLPMLGRATRQIEATPLIWEFFANCHRAAGRAGG